MQLVLILISLLGLHAGSFRADAATAMEGDLRLVHWNPDLQSCGRVEVFHNGSWGTVCDNSWHKRDADVACRQLGYSRGSRFRCYAACFGEGEGKVWLDSLSCPRNGDKLMQCDYREWGEHDCSHAKDAGVCCKGELTPVPLQTDGTRLRISCPCAADGCNSCAVRFGPRPGECGSTRPTAMEGMLEVSFGDVWLPVSANGWTEEAARVACGELGYPRVVDDDNSAVLPNERCAVEETESLGRYSGVAGHVVTSVQCHGSEMTLAECTLAAGPGSNGFCAVKLQCGFLDHPDCTNTTRTHRLRSGAVPWRGRVEVREDGGSWGTVVDERFRLAEANVACRAAGFGTAIAVQNGSEYGRGIGPIHYQNLRCNGNETSLSECKTSLSECETSLSECDGASGSGLDHSRDVGVHCRSPTPCSTPMRLVEGYSMESEGGQRGVGGYVQYWGSQGMGLVCAWELDVWAARVLCAGTNNNMFLLNTTQVAPPPPPSPPSAGVGVFYRGSVHCTGEEAHVSECSISLDALEECPHGLVQHIMCTSCVPDLVPDLEDFRSSLHPFIPAITHTPMTYLTCALEEKCLSSSAQYASSSDYRILIRFASTTHNWGRCPLNPNLDRDEWIFHDCHNHYHSFEAFVDFNLHDPDTGAKVAEGHKASFCLEDSMCADGYQREYSCRRTGPQGISPNCGDRYRSYLDCQWIDITGVESGTYLLSQSLNPHGDATESDYSNNQITCRVGLSVETTTVTLMDCWQSDHI